MRLDQQWPAGQFLEVVSAPDCRVHFGQFGEDCLLADLLQNQRNGFYVDIGCHDPFRYSNTYLLWKMLDWRGINIDADIRAIQRFQTARPHDINLNFGIDEVAGRRNFTMFQDGAVNTFDPEMAQNQQQQFGAARNVEVEIKTLAGVLDDYLPAATEIGYLNIDCEGLDERVLRSNNWDKYRPKFMTVELHGFDLAHAAENRAVRYLAEQGYQLISFFWVTGLFRRIQ